MEMPYRGDRARAVVIEMPRRGAQVNAIVIGLPALCLPSMCCSDENATIVAVEYMSWRSGCRNRGGECAPRKLRCRHRACRVYAVASGMPLSRRSSMHRSDWNTGSVTRFSQRTYVLKMYCFPMRHFKQCFKPLRKPDDTNEYLIKVFACEHGD